MNPWDYETSHTGGIIHREKGRVIHRAGRAYGGDKSDLRDAAEKIVDQPKRGRGRPPKHKKYEFNF